MSAYKPGSFVMVDCRDDGYKIGKIVSRVSEPNAEVAEYKIEFRSFPHDLGRDFYEWDIVGLLPVIKPGQSIVLVGEAQQ